MAYYPIGKQKSIKIPFHDIFREERERGADINFAEKDIK
jgi:hypothetical protein